MTGTAINFVAADGLNIFYREAGPTSAPVILLLHGYPTSSHQYRNLIPLLSHKYHVIAPDLPGFGFTEVPDSRNYNYSFENLTTSIEAFIDALNIKKFSVYVFDYGAPVGLRIALRRPKAIQAIITQNGNAYAEGLGESFWAPAKAYWKSGSEETKKAIKAQKLNLEAVKWQYTVGTKVPIAPEAYYLDFALLSRPATQEYLLDLFYDYRTNVDLYPRFQEYFRNSQVPLLAVWGKNDPIFIPAGAEAFKNDLPNAEIELIDAGHFAVETNNEEIAGLTLKFLSQIGL